MSIVEFPSPTGVNHYEFEKIAFNWELNKGVFVSVPYRG